MDGVFEHNKRIGVAAEVFLSDEPPQADPVSGKFKHISKGALRE